ncbi:hypothetical protein FA13DRAFT_1816652 [Coprinellus micaceus]|uniref:Fungal-type protein kinase domain-containing protein n=1 Tax=Coprinellus micaceus TaxID=71717 RepID=A0A4Y7SYB1_COPMI|nr:hypothetical protein FA13DRAFT_1816652 [Coprinellus micaceus]
MANPKIPVTLGRLEIEELNRETATPYSRGTASISTLKTNGRKNPDYQPIVQEELILSDRLFKWSWRERTLENEGDIIVTAEEREKEYLGDYHNDVVNHLPEVKHVQDHLTLFSGNIRQYPRLDATEARSPSFIVSSRLSDASSLDGEVIRGKLWKIIRCTLLLWRLGISHIDISLSNFMVNETKERGPYMVLNDFDLASAMNPGNKFPQKKEFGEWTGTKPLMGLELLQHNYGNIERVCRHDLESIIWVLVWLCRKDPAWYSDTHENVFVSKLSIPSQMPNDTEKKNEALWQPVTKVVRTWMVRWGNASMDGQLDGLSENDVLDAVNEGFPCPEEYKEWDWWNCSAPCRPGN